MAEIKVLELGKTNNPTWVDGDGAGPNSAEVTERE